MIITRTSMSSRNGINTSPVTAISGGDLDMESKERLVDKCQQPLELTCTNPSSPVPWEFPILVEDEESNHLVQTVIDDLQRAQESGSVCQLCEAWNALGLIRLHTRKNPAGALECHELALQLIISSSQNDGIMIDSFTMATTLSDIGLCYERLEQTKQAVLAYEQAIVLMKGTSSSHPQKMSLERTMARLSRT